ncbi:putative sugar phosphatases of the HAD superfamily [Archaeoglobus sulfaticallidus PM70-1]|uniref:Putative sugar phosphatases of the HAD superfamily n=1 Tax=Archaeoglobus sulfaticallidus PM70-1 TaxID=387631 RepID=N0B9B6_9EURY|nr:HAD-IIA family hydrolase [Archaeoglobus sulfaticallidus]AGK60204.1 putative sugar phosphatases of the HAD superfamily [Archaeoglobus sulfaticallidus PM70-1]
MHPLLSKKGFILDVDGVIGRGKKPIKPAISAVKKLIEMEKKVVFVSNNSTRSRRIYTRRFRDYGLEVDEDQMILTTYATAQYIKENYGKMRIFTTGEIGLIEELELAGHEIVDYEEAEMLVVGSNREINFELITKALRMCLSKKPYIATNPDRIFPSEDGPIPGTGMIIGALYWMTGRMPDCICGKPEKVIMLKALEYLGLEAKDVVVVGDQIDVDVIAGKSINAETLLVLSGVTTRDNLENMIKKYGVKPDYVLEDLSKLFD